MECTERTLITLAWFFYHPSSDHACFDCQVKRTQSTALKQKCFDLRSFSPSLRNCNGVTACVTRLVTLLVCILGVVILERAMLYQNVGSNGREQ